MFQLVPKGIFDQISISHRYLKRKKFLKSGRADMREPAMFETRVIKTIIISKDIPILIKPTNENFNLSEIIPDHMNLRSI